MSERPSTLAGTRHLFALAARRDRFVLPIVTIAAFALVAFSVAAVIDLYPSQPQRDSMARTLATSPALLMMRGAPMGASTGALGVVLLITVLGLLVMLVTTFAVVRHTRQSEEAGRTELLLAAPVGRHAPLAAALLLAGLLDLLLGIATAGGFVAGGEGLGDSLAIGAAMTLLGGSFAVVAAITAQVSGTSRAANGFAAIAVGIAWLVRGLANVAGTTSGGGTIVDPAWASWLSPLGWAEQVRAFGADGTRWWGLAVPATWILVGIGMAVYAANRRDLGAGMLTQRPGPARGGASLGSPLGLAWRTQRTAVAGWLVGIAAMGVAVGTLIDSVRSMLDGNPALARYIRDFGGGVGALEDAYFSGMAGMMGLLATGLALQLLLAPHAEEASGRIEPTFAGAVSRTRWLGAHVALSLAASTAALVVAGAASGSGAAVTQGDSSYVGRMLEATLVQAPAVWVICGLLVVVFGLVPRRMVSIGVLLVAWCVIVGQFGELLELPTWLQAWTPFEHVPQVPMEAMDDGALIGLAACAVLLVAAGMLAFRRRDLQPGG